MANIYVIMAGLLAIVPPDGEGNGGMVLLRKADGTDTVAGKRIPKHLAQVRFRPKEGQGQSTKGIDGKEVRLGFAEGVTPRLSIADEKESFLRFSDFLNGSSEQVVVRSGCVGNQPEEHCKIDEKALLAGRVLLTHGTLKPVELQMAQRSDRLGAERFRVAPVSGRIVGFKPVNGGPDVSFVKSVANAALLEVQAPEGTLLIGDESFDLAPLTRDETAELGLPVTDEPSYVIWVENLPENGHVGHAAGSGDGADTHFALLYDFLSGASNLSRLLPVVAFPSTRGDEGTPPGSQCIPPVVPRPSS